ncbi:NUDIX domain-containing protein [Aquipuribacter sp. SD81]|uniref:NUDIX domain-containing protein n=1 Tax=Aquipuribacter sp. SD81 TaxID=3127703 RepID=UPI003019FABA
MAGLLRRVGRALLVHRSPSRRWYPDVWDLPGGHVRPGEQPSRALERELEEELGVTVTVAGQPFADVHAVDYRLSVWVIDQWEGEPVNRAPHEHDAVAWFGRADVGTLRLADRHVAELVRSALAVTGVP